MSAEERNKGCNASQVTVGAIERRGGESKTTEREGIHTLVGHGSRVLNGRGGRRRAGLPKLPPGLLLGRLFGVRVRPRVTVEQNVLLQRRVLVHALELGHADNGLLALSSRAGAGPHNIIVGRHLGGLKKCCSWAGIRMYSSSCAEKAPATRRGSCVRRASSAR